MAPRRSTGRLVALEGMSGIGKSRAARELAAGGHGIFVVPEAFDRMADPPALVVPDRAALWAVERGLFREELRRCRRAVDRRSRGHLVLVDTGFLGPLTYSIGMATWDPRRDIVAPMRALYEQAALASHLELPDLTILLEVSDSTRRRRTAADPIGHPSALRRRHARIGAIEHRLWSGTIARSLGRRFAVVSGAGSPSAVAGRIRDVMLDREALPPWPPGDSARALVEMLGGPTFGKR
jgi:hypothetical protein